MSHLGELLSTYLDGELTVDEQTVVAEHLAGCEICRIELDDVAAARAWVRSLPTLELPVLQMPATPHRLRRALVGIAAAFALLIGAGVLLEPGPQEISVPELVQVHLARSGAVPVLNSGGLASVTNTPAEAAP